MELRVPLGLMTPDRARQTAAGANRARAVVAQAFPPRPEDVDGRLAMAVVEVCTNRAVTEGLTARAGDQTARQWWLEGLLLGYCAAAVSALRTTDAVPGGHPVARLEAMEAAVGGRFTGDQLDAARVVFALCRAVAEADDVSVLWALEHAWRPADAGDSAGPDADSGVTPGQVRARVSTVISAAVSICCASWVLRLADDH